MGCFTVNDGPKDAVEATPAQEIAPVAEAQADGAAQNNLLENEINAETPVQNVAETVLSVFVMPISWTLLNMVLAIFA